MKLLEQLGKRIVFFEGGMGSILQQNGLAPGELPEVWNLQKPDFILNIHRNYLKAGCDIVKTNTFGANSIKLAHSDYTARQLIEQATALAKQAVTENGHGLVALDIGPTGKLLRPLGDLSFADAYTAFAEMATIGQKAGADLALIETMSDTHEVKAAVLAVKENTTLPVFVTMTFDENEKLLTGGTIPAAVALLEGLGVDALGLNCGLGPTQMKAFLKTLSACCSIPIIVNPNAGLPKNVNGQTVYDVDPIEFAQEMQQIVQGGAWVIGGCCGTTPAHLAETVRLCKDLSPVPITPKQHTVISSYTHTVRFGPRPILIGERINPTGKKRFKQALKEHDMDYILKEGITQQQNGAHVLDVNVGLPEIDEPAMMEETIMALQSVIDLPLQIDTSDPIAMEKAMRIYNGKPLINSVNGKEHTMHEIFPLVKKYGGVVIALTLDESGIPPTAQGRLAVAEKIVSVAEQYGIPKTDLIFDVLAMTVSADQQASAVTLEALRLIRDKLGAYTSLGVSNISFGLPQRENINSAFFTMALQNGLSAAIMNPASQSMMTAYRSYCALSGADPQCMDYIAAYSGQPTQTAPAGTQMPLDQAVIKGLKESAHTAAQSLVSSGMPALEIINQMLVPALDVVGQQFEQGTLFLPQLLMSAEAAKAAFEVIKGHFEKSGAVQEKGEKIILATVKGDIHDIGKNIVKVLLENYSYDVIDLGKDVDPDLIVSTAVEQNVPLVGLSALMTTTVVNMEETIRRLRQAAPQVKVMVGGAVLTQEYADMIHADFYSKDAMGSVHYAQRLFGKA